MSAREVIRMVLVIFLVSLRTLGQAVPADREILEFKHLSEQDGLPHRGVNCIIQDRKGFMWFGSQGLCKYDGYRVKVYKPKTEFMRYNVTAICEDREGMLWVGTLWAGIARFDPTTEQFTVYQYDPNDSNSLSDPRVTAIYEDSEGTLWIGTPSGGLNRFDRATKRLTRYKHDPSDPTSLSSNVVRGLYEDRAGRLWAGTKRGLNLLDRSTGQFARYLHDPTDPQSLSTNNVTGAMLQDRDGHLWIGTAGDFINHFDPGSGVFARSPPDPNDLAPGSNFVSAVCEDRFGRIWIGTRSGLWRKDLDHDTLHLFRHDSTAPSSLSDDHIRCIYEDQSGLIWVGTAAGGISRFDPAPDPLTVYRRAPKNAKGLSHNHVVAISKDQQGRFWIGTSGGGLNSLDQVTGRWLRYSSDPSDPHSLGSSLVSAVNTSPTEPGALWVGTPSSGLYRFDGPTGRFVRLRHDPTDGSDLSLNCICSLFKDRENTLWIGTKNGLCWLDSAAKRFGRYRPDMSDPHRPQPVDVVAIHEDQFGVLWVGSRGDGLYRLDKAIGRFSCYRSDKSDPHTLSDDSVQVIHEDSRGMLWIGTRDGLSRFDRGPQSFSRFLGVNNPIGEEDWQPRNDIRGIVEDNAGDLWVSTGRGIYILSDISNSGFRTRYYESLAGHWLGNFCVGACLKSSRGDLVFGSHDGLLAFHPQRMEDSDPPPVVLTDLKLNYESVAIRADGSTALVRHISASEKITIGHGVKALTLEFAALDFRHPGQNQYAYMLEGLIDDWVHKGSARSVTLTNLDPGDYVFRVKASNSDGVWNEAGTSLRLIVTPFWWETTWFKLLVVAVVIGGVVGGYEGRVRLAKARRRSLEEKVSDRTSELRVARDKLSEARDNLELQVQQRTAELRQEIAECEKAQKEARTAHETLYHYGRVRMLEALSSSLSHEMQQPLTGVLSNAQAVEMLLENPQADIDEVRDTVKDIVADAKRAGEVIWQLRAFLRKQDLDMKPLDLNNLIEEVLSVLHSDMVIHDMSAVKDLAADLPQVVGDDVQLKQVLINLIVNAQQAMESSGIPVHKLIVHTSMDGTGRITVGVEDSGPGLEENELARIFEPFYTTKKDGTGMGLAISRFIVEAHGGQIWAESCANGGARVCFSLPVMEGSPES